MVVGNESGCGLLDWCSVRIAYFFASSTTQFTYKINLPFSDLSGYFKNAPCKRRYAETQEVFYTGWTHIHRLKVEEEYFSNGISTVYGRMSYQHPDIGRDCNLQDTSGLNAFL